MGSTALMEDSTRHRRRPQAAAAAAAAAESSSIVQIPSGDSSQDNGDTFHGQPQNHTQRPRPRRRRRRNGGNGRDETPFIVLFLQVGATVLLVSLAAVVLYRRVYPYDPHAGMVEEIYYLVDDAISNDDDNKVDNNNNNNHQEVVDPTKSKNIILQGASSRDKEYDSEDEAKLSVLMKQQKKAMEEAAAAAAAAATAKAKAEITPPPETLPPLPTFDLSDAAQWDAFGITLKLGVEPPMNNNTAESITPAKPDKNNATKLLFWQVAKGLRDRFAETYGSENIARMLLDKGMTTFFPQQQQEETENGNIIGGGEHTQTQSGAPPADIVATACRLQQAQQDQRPFRIAFGGYSVTAGRGNKFEQSFPFQMQRLLEQVFQVAGIPDLQVTNAAIGGCPAFPYGWCMTNFWGSAPDVVSWDYSMNEAGGVPEGLEAYIRHLLFTYSDMNPPKLIVKDTYLADKRRDVLGAYAQLLKDPVVLHTGPAVKPFLERHEQHNPIGFQEWRKFGAPVGAPGQALHHPALKEHELIGWMLAMHFLTALEYLVIQSSSASKPLECASHLQPVSALPPPVTGSKNTTNYDGILFGHPSQTRNDEWWQMNPIRCRTTFQPISSGDLSELVVSGTTAEDLDVALPKSQMYYNQGWTFDLSEEEKQTKRKLSIYENGLGFIDSKEAYYGIYESPVMQLLLPYEEESPEQKVPKVGQPAADWFESVVICQVNEKRDATACNMGSDLGFFLGGANATNTTHMMKDTGTLYLGKPVCVKIPIPPNATLTSHNEQLSLSSSSMISRTAADEEGQQEQQRLLLLEHDQVGLLVEINVTNSHIAHIHQACSVSHVIWEQRRLVLPLLK